MSAVDEALFERNLPKIMKFNSDRAVKNAEDFWARREEIKRILAEEEYGYIPKKPDHLSVELITEESFCAGKATHRLLKFIATIGEHEFSFPVQSVIPKGEGIYPAFIHIDFEGGVPTKFTPIEEITDGGFAVFSFSYEDITRDDGNFKNGIAKHFGSRRRASAPGKLAIWAWAAMRVMDYVETLPEINKSRTAVIGHSRLGKAALLAGAFDERFQYVISNNSGCSGASLSRKTTGETVVAITNRFPYWFCPKYVKCAVDFAEKSKFDQHFLLSLIAPRHLIVGSAKDDLWADPTNEFLSAVAASEGYNVLGVKGLIHNGELPKDNVLFNEGNICYYKRSGEHYLSREDWQTYMKYITES